MKLLVNKGKLLDCILDNPNNVTVRPVDRPKDQMIHVNLDRVTICPEELPDTSWLGPKCHHNHVYIVYLLFCIIMIIYHYNYINDYENV